MSRKNTIVRWRLRVVLGIFMVAGLIIISQLYRVQIMQGATYSKKADRQHISPTADLFDRGSIYFSKSDGSLINAASVRSGYKVAINPRSLTHPEDVYNNLGFHLDLDEDFYISRADKSDDPYEEIAKRVDGETGKKLKELDMEGVFVLDENWRFYPGKDLAAHAVGFVSFREDELRGQYGLERFYDEILERNQENVFRNFFAEVFSSASDRIIKGKKSGGSIVTTIEPEVQAFVESQIDGILNGWRPKFSGGIVMDPNNGEIISMALGPDFDLNEFNLVKDPLIYNNHLVENVYEMGSIVKPLTIAIGLDTGSITPQTTYNDLGFIELDTEKIYNFDKEARGVVNMQEVINQSLNTGVAFVVSKVGNQEFSEYMKKLIGEKTGIDLPNEAKSLVSNLDSGRNIEYATASFGQGVAISPIGAIRSLASLGNGGKLVWPHLVKEIEYDSGRSEKIEIEKPIQVFKPETSETISRMLVSAVDNALLDGTVAISNYSVAAKTGTAQIAKRGEAGYYDDRFLHTFFGYFPAYDPRFIVFLYAVEPIGAEYASDTLTSPFMKITKFLINHYEIEPDREEKT